MVGRCGLSPWGLTWDHQPKPHQLDHPAKNTIFSQLPTSNIKTYCWHELFPPSVDHSGQPARQPAQRNRPCGTFHKKCSAGFSFTSFGIFLFLCGTFERSLQVSWCCLNCSSPGAHSSPVGRPGLPALFFLYICSKNGNVCEGTCSLIPMLKNTGVMLKVIVLISWSGRRV